MFENPNIKTFILKDNDELAGYFEQIFHLNQKNCEIAYFVNYRNNIYVKKIWRISINRSY
jgi:hypothetical protein